MLLLLLACRDAPPSLAGRWAADPDGVALELAGLPPTAQLAAVEEILLADPENIGRLCAVLADGPARRRCWRIQTRPHLWRQETRPIPALPSPLDQIPPLTSPCGDWTS